MVELLPSFAHILADKSENRSGRSLKAVAVQEKKERRSLWWPLKETISGPGKECAETEKKFKEDFQDILKKGLLVARLSYCCITHIQSLCINSASEWSKTMLN